MKCPNCGKNNPPDAKYCYNCGVALPKRLLGKTYLDRIRPIIFTGILFDLFMAPGLLIMSLASSNWSTPPPGGWGLFSPGVWRLIYLGGGISLVLALFIFFVSAESRLILGVPLVIVGFIISIYPMSGIFGKLSDAVAWKETKLISLSCCILGIFTIFILIKRFKRAFLTFVLILSMLILTFSLPKINDLLKNKGTSSSLPSSTTTVSTVLDKVQLLSPKNGSTLPPGNLTLSWNHVNNATKYEVVIYNEAGNPVLDETTSSTTFTTTLNSEGTYIWIVRAGDNNGKWAPWSDKGNFYLAGQKNATLRVLSIPAGAELSVDGKNYGITPIYVTVASGNHKVVVSKAGYEDALTTVDIYTDKEISLTLKPKSAPQVKNGVVSLSSNPSGAAVSVDSTFIGSTPIVNYSLKAGSYTLRVSKSGYLDYTVTVGIKSGETKNLGTINLVKLNQSNGFISINSNPSGADIFIDGNLIKDTTPLYNYQLKPGTHSIKISMFGYLDYNSSIQVSENQVTNLGVINLQPIPIQNGFLTVNSNPSGADIFIDGNLIKDTTPLYNYQLKPGTHSIKISMYGYKDSIKSIYIEANKILSISVTLEKLEESFTMHTYGISPAHQKIVLQVGSNIITVDDKTYYIENGPEIKDGVTFIPLIAFSEAFGTRVNWDPETQGITVTFSTTAVGLQIGSTSAVINGTVMTLDVPPYIKSNEIMVPLRFIAESFALRVDWDASTKTITILFF